MREAYVVSAARTPVGRANRGALRNVRPDDMAAVVLREVTARASIEPGVVQDVLLGCAFPEAAQGMNVARVAAAAAGFPDSVSAMTLNRLCASGLEAIAIAASRIEAGQYDVAVAGGVESMSMVPMGGSRFLPNPKLTKTRPHVYTSMGHCGDNVARRFGISREEMDHCAYHSHMKALAAARAGKFDDEIVPLEVSMAGNTTRFDTDEGPRPDTTPEALAKLPPAFAATPKLGSCTAGNSSQTSDGAAAVCLMSAKALKEYEATPLARLRSYSVAGGDPALLGPAQLEAIPRACSLAGIALDAVGLIENNEAFASQCLYVVREMRLDPEKVNVNGGAIALGHPLGCTGAKLSVQILHEMMRRHERHGLVTMCIGGGMGAAGIFEWCG